MIHNLKRTNDPTNPSEGWQFELTSTGETYYYMTGPERTDYVYAAQHDSQGNYIGNIKTDKTHTYSASTFLTCYRGKEPEETEITWSLMEYLPLTPENAESRVLRVLVMGERMEEPVVYV